MNAGLGNMDGLRKQLLPQSMMGERRFDSALQAIGLGMAALMERFCDRKFARVVNDQAVFMGDRSSFLLPRYPVESISTVETKLKDSDGWQVVDVDTFVESTSPMAGVVYLADGADAGPYWGQVRFTFTGGYWFETAEPDDAAYPSALPDGAATLPDDLRLAWLIQCEQVWALRDKLGVGLSGEGDQSAAGRLSNLELVPLVKGMLETYRRMQLV